MKRQLRKLLSKTLPPDVSERIYNSYDIVGDVAIIRLTEETRRYGDTFAEAIMCIHKNIKTVLTQVGAVQGDFRLRELKYVAGEGNTITVCRESGCSFLVDLAKSYFSPRLHTERMRIAKQVAADEVVVNMFAGVGCFSVLIAKHSSAAKIHSIDINPVAVQYMRENIRVNGTYGRVVPVLGDAKQVIKETLRHVADRVLMPLPEKALECLPYALLCIKETGGWIHYYDFEHATKREDPIGKVETRVAKKLRELNASFEVPCGRVLRSTGPNWHQVALDIHVRPRKQNGE